MSTKKNETADGASIETIIGWATKRPGWHVRLYPPIVRTLDGGCELTVITAALWRSRRIVVDHGWRLAPVVDLAEQRRRRRVTREAGQEQRRA